MKAMHQDVATHSLRAFGLYDKKKVARASLKLLSWRKEKITEHGQKSIELKN